MADELQRTCVECGTTMSPIVIMDNQPGAFKRHSTGVLEYRLPDDKVSFWTGRYPSTGVVRAYLCPECGRIALYGSSPEAATEVADDTGAG